MRVIAGTYGGRPLKSLEGRNTRPTSDKLKETIFNIIGPYFKGGKVLDLYAGSGALGIEAVSRGMGEAVLVDSAQSAINIIESNVEITKEADKFEVLHTSADAALNLLANRHEKFTLVFLDPPYEDQAIEADIQKMVEAELLNDVALVLCEVAREIELPEKFGDLELWNNRTYGKTKIVIYQRVAK